MEQSAHLAELSSNFSQLGTHACTLSINTPPGVLIRLFLFFCIFCFSVCHRSLVYSPTHTHPPPYPVKGILKVIHDERYRQAVK